MKKIASFLLAMLLCASMITSCNKPTSPLPSDTEKLTEDTQSKETEKEKAGKRSLRCAARNAA